MCKFRHRRDVCFVDRLPELVPESYPILDSAIELGDLEFWQLGVDACRGADVGFFFARSKLRLRLQLSLKLEA